MASPMSWRIGLRSLPSSGAGSRRAKGLEVSRMKARKAVPIQPCTAMTRARSASGRELPNSASKRPEQPEDQHPEQHGALVVAPHAGDLEEKRLGRVAVLPDVLHRKVGGHVGGGQRGKGDCDAAERGDRRRAPPPRQAAHRRQREPDQRHRRLDQQQRQRQDKRVMTELGNRQSPSLAHPLAFLPDALRLERVDDFARHVILVVLGEHVVGVERPPRSARPRQRCLAPRGRGRAGCRDSRRGSSSTCR